MLKPFRKTHALNYSIIQVLYTLQFLRFGILFPLVPLFAEQIGGGHDGLRRRDGDSLPMEMSGGSAKT